MKRTMIAAVLLAVALNAHGLTIFGPSYSGTNNINLTEVEAWGDGLWLRLDGTTTPSADIDWGGQGITNLGTLHVVGDAIISSNLEVGAALTFPQGPEMGLYFGANKRLRYDLAFSEFELNDDLNLIGALDTYGDISVGQGVFVASDPTSGDMVGDRAYNDGRYLMSPLSNAVFALRPPATAYTDLILKASTNNFDSYWIVCDTSCATSSLTGVKAWYTDSGRSGAQRLPFVEHDLAGADSIEDDLTDANSVVGAIRVSVGASHGLGCMNAGQTDLRWSVHWSNNANNWRDGAGRTIVQPVEPEWRSAAPQ
jgi:hypothetical protein